MRKNLKLTIAIAAAIAVAGITSILVRHGGKTSTSRNDRAQVMSPQIPDTAIVTAIQNANIRITGLSATTVGGIVVLKGHANPAAALQAANVVKQLGFARIANLIVTITPVDDENIRRVAERQLASTRALDGCDLRVSVTKGVLRVEGTTYNELQIDLARNVLRGVGASEVQIALNKM
jgi:BON domain